MRRIAQGLVSAGKSHRASRQYLRVYRSNVFWTSGQPKRLSLHEHYVFARMSLDVPSAAGHVTFQGVVHYHAVGIEAPAQGAEGALHALNPSTRETERSGRNNL